MLRSSARPSGHAWTFFRRGGLDQVAIQSAADLQALGQLDPKLWVALSCPAQGLELDPKTLALIDSDGDGRIRVPELVAAIQWACARLSDPAELIKREADLPLGALNGASDEGKTLSASARQVLSNLGRPESASLNVGDFADKAVLFPAGRIHGDGVVPAEAAQDPETKQLVSDIAGCLGTVKGTAGGVGITEEKAKTFFEQVEARSAWLLLGSDPSIAILGAGTAAAYAALAAVRAKVDDYFARCRLAAFDPRSLASLNRGEADYAALASQDLSSASAAAFPIAFVASGRPLPLFAGANPAWSDALATLAADTVDPLLRKGKTELSPEEWSALVGRFAHYEAWRSAKPAGSIDALSDERVREIAAGSGKAGLDKLFALDRELAPGFGAVSDLERLARYRRDLGTLIRNFVNFADFYSRGHGAIFQAGTLYFDSRSFDLCVRVDDPAAHASLASASRLCLAYLDCRRAGSPGIKIASALTQGDTDYVFVGRNGVFYDRAGRDWDATVTKIIENPVSIRQGFLTPYKRVAAFVEGQFSKFAAARDQASGDALNKGVSSTAQVPGAQKAPAPAFDIAKFAGIFAAIGLGIGAVAGAVSSIAVGFMHLAPWQMPLAIAGALLLISGPSMVMAAIKLRQRNLGPVLEASGWAINGRVKINRPLGNSLTALAALPPGSKRKLDDPYADRRQSRRRKLLVLAVLLLSAALIVAKVRGTWPFGP